MQELLRVTENIRRKTNSASIFEESGLLFEARDEKQEKAFRSFKERSGLCGISTKEAISFLPNLQLQKDHIDDFFGLYIPQGIVLRPKLYLENLWHACQVKIISIK